MTWGGDTKKPTTGWGTVTPLHQVNGGTITCQQCGMELGDERAVANTPFGPRFFCKMENGDNPEYSCYTVWRRSRQ